MITANASLLEWVWTLIALGGVVMGGLAVTTALIDAATAFHPPKGLLSTMEERALGAWITVKWTGITLCHVCNLIIGWRSMRTPPPPPTDPLRQENALITGLCLIAVEIILVGLTFGQLYTRWLILKLAQTRAAARLVARPPGGKAPAARPTDTDPARFTRRRGPGRSDWDRPSGI